jgi:anti-anti-sigma factor
MPDTELRYTRAQVQQGVLVITITEPEVKGDELAVQLRKEFFRALEEHEVSRVVLDFQPVKLLFSAGLRPLLSLHRRLAEQGGALVLCNLAPLVSETLHATRLISTSRSYIAPFDTAPNLAEAVAKLQAK